MTPCTAVIKFCINLHDMKCFSEMYYIDYINDCSVGL